MNHRLYLSAIAVALASACATTEDQKPAPTPEARPAPSASPSSSTSPVKPPSTAGTPTKPGASAPAAAKGGVPGAGQSVYFDYDRYEIKPEYRYLIESHAKYLRENPSVTSRIEGHADERGSREYNIALGQRRAEAVTRALNLLGVPDNRIEAVSFGEEKPRADGHDETSWSQNRRGDFVYK